MISEVSDEQMKVNLFNIYLSTILPITLAGCDQLDNSTDIPVRWYTMDQVEQGKILFQTHCAVCHGPQAEGTGNWMELDANGQYPPPPLDGSAHAWHHPLEDLHKVITNGGAPYGGTMPAFGTVLSDADILAVIASFQQTWPEDVYERWTSIDAARQDQRVSPSPTTRP